MVKIFKISLRKLIGKLKHHEVMNLKLRQSMARNTIGVLNAVKQDVGHSRMEQMNIEPAIPIIKVLIIIEDQKQMPQKSVVMVCTVIGIMIIGKNQKQIWFMFIMLTGIALSSAIIFPRISSVSLQIQMMGEMSSLNITIHMKRMLLWDILQWVVAKPVVILVI